MEERKKRLIGLGVLVLVGVLIVLAVLSREGAIPVETATVGKREILRTIAAAGYFAAAEEKEVYALYPLVIEEVLVEAGDVVEAGQVLARADQRELEVQRQALLAELSELESQMANLENTLPLQLAQAESQVAAAREEFAQAQREAEALSQLYEMGAVPELDMQRARARLSASEAQLRQAEALLAETQSRTATLQQYRQQVQVLTARLHLLEEKLADCQVTAPWAGRVAEVFIKAGAVVAPGTPLFLLHTPELLVKAEVLAQDAPALEVGQRVILSGEVLGDEELAGTLTRIHPRAVEKLSELGVIQHRVPVEIAVEVIPQGIRPGYPVEVEIVTAETMALALPREAVFKLEGEDYVFLVRDSRAVLTPVRIGLEGDDYLEVLSGLEAGDVVIVNPPKEVDDGTVVTGG